MSKLSPDETVRLMQVVSTSLGLLGHSNSVAGIILEYSTYDGVKALFGTEAKPYEINGAILDPRMHNTFVAFGMLIMRGTE